MKYKEKKTIYEDERYILTGIEIEQKISYQPETIMG